MRLELDAASPAVYAVAEQHNLMIPTRDRLHLAADVYFPALDTGQRRPEPAPVILLRTPYNKAASAEHGRFFAARGFIYVAQDVRGCWESEGAFFPFADEAPDGFDTIAWIASQPWCNRQVGTIGCSYCAAVQSAAACLAPPALTTMIVQCGPSSFFDSSMRHNGALELRFLVYAFTMAANSRTARQNPGRQKELTRASKDIWTYLRAGPIRRGCTPLALVPELEQWVIDLQTRATFDDFWRKPGFGPKPWLQQHADVPTLYLGGWYDTYTRGTLENAVNFAAAKPRGPVQAIVGPWTHGTETLQNQRAGDADFGQHATMNYLHLCRNWFGQWLAREDNGFAATPRIDYFLMGTAAAGNHAAAAPIQRGGEWRQASTWPPPAATPTAFYLHPQAGLARTSPAAANTSTSFAADPDHPVPTIGGSLSAMPLPAGCFHQIHDPRFGDFPAPIPLAARQDVACFFSDPLEHDLDIAGPVRARLFVATDGLDTDFTVKLVDICPADDPQAGSLAINVTDGIQRLRFRNGYDHEELAQPGQPCRLEFDLFPTACRFGRGHRLRVDIASSNFPRFDVNPNTGEPLGQHRLTRKAVNTVFHDPDHPSAIILHVLPEQA